MSRLISIIFVLLLALPAGSYLKEEWTIESSSNRSTLSLAEYLDQTQEKWFRTGKKEYTVQAMMVSKEISFHNELEVTDYTVHDDEKTVILKGHMDEMWTSGLSKVVSTYTKTDGSPLDGADFAQKDVYINIVTIPEPDRYFAMYVPVDISVTVLTGWGVELHTNLPNAPHGNGDYLVCRADDNSQPDLSDVWVLNGILFPEYYALPGPAGPSGQS